MATTTNYSWTTPDDTDLVKDGASAIRSLGTAIDSTVFTNAGNALQKSTIDAKGDLLVGTADNTVGRLAVGTNGYTLVADSAETTGLKWAAAAGGGKVLQVVSATTTTDTTIATTTMTDTTITATITPTAVTSKILVLVDGTHLFKRTGSSQAVAADLLRGATVIGDFFTEGGGRLEVTGGTYIEVVKQFSFNFLDSPNTTSATTYKLQANISTTSGSGSSRWQYEGSPSTITLLEIGA
jgi:hypothetical protein